MKLFWIGMVTLMFMCGCGLPSVVRDPTTGRLKVRDTALERRIFIHEVNDWIEDEQRGLPPPMVHETWNDWWVDSIDRNKKYIVGDVDFYVNYIIEARRRAGFPELKFGKK